MPTALLLENLHPHARTILESAGFDVVTRTGALDEAELVEALAGVQVLGIRSKTDVPAEVLAAAPDLEVVGAFCIGTNQIDLHAAAGHGIAVFNAPFSNTRSVVEIAIADIISLTRRLTVFDKDMHAGVWNKSATGAHEVRGRTLGIIGYGNIGTQLSVLAENLGMSVVFYDTAEKLALGNARRMDTLDELLEEADVVTLHVDGRAGNAGMFGAKQIARMRPGSIFLNLSRGFVVDYAALRDAVLSGHVAGAAVDVFPTEPKRKGDPFESELRGLPNVILTPHTGGSTEEAQAAIGQFVANKVRDYLATGSTNLSVNLPNLALDQRPDAHRIAYLHRNVPGVLATINATLAEHGVNIEGQLLATRGELGYVVTDVASPVPQEVADVLRGRPESLRLRLLD
ncbi:phosphoglycerate dehydrogenase [Cellulomonas sp. zg-ZUI222]|uniref:D-3-phosphoglycerate dehydrogenase n=1 Tax=Cellulomonas wangleii TaxID=2816956 RepID=A0ABX8D8K8_9CELL|nr:MULTISPECIES: phosphoglycerate dehydrogenase [Cellulomonas]MBO0900640.1 phosphoglycerate dehydrogenase [Cellulomonas sp. zg-ZUI22]MBO0921308.1 phosphoglycerate dehydrogenase [Cellulomonas wangleii]MBO0925724.1 phosphoglycerate dehydrogenase [Cellulomonas wangleii]QVI63749.1 phosphoglycerate dehydrogenase [Cellulomonas wangleii]